MNLISTLECYGTSEGLQKAWDERGRGRKLSDKVERARASYVPVTREKQQAAELNEKILAAAIGGEVTHNNSAFDVVKGKYAIEVKTIFPGVKNNKITMHPKSRMRKEAFAKQFKMKAHTVIFDERDEKIHVAVGVGAFRLGHGSTKEVTLNQLKEMFK
jgi:hypothetical protein